jgi:hypothetical protein
MTFEKIITRLRELDDKYYMYDYDSFRRALRLFVIEIEIEIDRTRVRSTELAMK